jgi:hypothetical protein
MWRMPECPPRERHAVGVMHMHEGIIAGSPNGRHLHPWRCPVRTPIEHQSIPASRQLLRSVAGIPRAPRGHKLKLLDQVREAIRMRH